MVWKNTKVKRFTHNTVFDDTAFLASCYTIIGCFIHIFPSLNFIVSILFQATNENLPPNVIKQLAKELKNLDDSPPEGIKVVVNDDDFSIIYADIDGPGMDFYFSNLFLRFK